MCEPITTMAIASKISLGISAAQTVMSLTAQRQQAKAQQASQKAASIRENKRYQREASAARLKEAQEDLVLANEIQEGAKKSKAALATAMVSAGESGVSGLSVDALMNDYTRQEADYRFSMTEQNRLQGINNQLQFDEMLYRNENNLIKINQPIKQPDYLGSMVNLAGSGMQIYGNDRKNVLTELKIKEYKSD